MIIFRNPGVLDPRSITTFGLTSKSDKESKIGRFGTGLKYALSTILRGGGEITIRAGAEILAFSVETNEFRGQEYQQVYLNGGQLPFTTSLGRDWEPWMAFRELYSNALDEDGELSRVDDQAPISEVNDETSIYVKWDAFEAIYYSIEEHFIVDEAPIWKGSNIEVYKGRSQFVFYRGIAVMKLKKPSAYRYNVTSYMSLTEDRTAAYPWMVNGAIATALVSVEDEEVAKTVTDASNEFEKGLNFTEDPDANPSSTFIGAASRHGLECNESAARLVELHVPDRDTTSAHVISPAQPGGKCLLQSLRLLRALNQDLSSARWVLDPSIKIPDSHMVRGDMIFICPLVFDNQKDMDRAVLTAWERYKGQGWLLNSFISHIDEQINSEGSVL